MIRALTHHLKGPEPSLRALVPVPDGCRTHPQGIGLDGCLHPSASVCQFLCDQTCLEGAQPQPTCGGTGGDAGGSQVQNINDFQAFFIPNIPHGHRVPLDVLPWECLGKQHAARLIFLVFYLFLFIEIRSFKNPISHFSGELIFCSRWNKGHKMARRCHQDLSLLYI